MEKKFKRIPFDLEFAKAITNGTKDGRVVTRFGENAKIIYWNRNEQVQDKPIVALIGENEECWTYTLSGNYYTNRCSNNLDLFLEVPDEQKFNEGDVIAYIDCNTIALFKGGGTPIVQDFYCAYSKERLFFARRLPIDNARLATEEEKQILIEALNKNGSDKAKEFLKRFFGINFFKPFDKVLFRRRKDVVWNAGFYNRPFSVTEHLVIGYNDSYWHCIPYNEQTKHLLGTTDDWEE